MKNILLVLLVCSVGFANAQIQTPRVSPSASVSATLGLTDIKIDYFTPKVKGRKIFGEGNDVLLANGKIWRTGANSGTKITFSDDVKVEGRAVPKGEYLIFTWPGTSEWAVSFYKDLTIGGNTDAYDISKELVRFNVKPEKLTEKVETLRFGIGDISEDNTSAKVQLAWENTSIKFTVVAEYDNKIVRSINNTLSTAARYYFDKKDMKEAMKFLDLYFADGKNADQFGDLNLKAQVQKALGDKAGALATAQKSLDMAKKSNNSFYVQQNEDLIKSLK